MCKNSGKNAANRSRYKKKRSFTLKIAICYYMHINYRISNLIRVFVKNFFESFYFNWSCCCTK